jgi:hypothetical protein
MPKKDAAAKKEPAEEAFRLLVQKCITSFETFGDDSLSLDFNRVLDTKLRALILQDYEYRTETKYLRAKKIMDDIKELDTLSSLAAGMYGDEDEDDGEYDVRGSKKKDAPRKPLSADKDTITMRLKAAQERRALLSEISGLGGDEADAVNIFCVHLTADDFEHIETIEITEESALDDGEVFDSLAGSLKEKLPESERADNAAIYAGRGSSKPEFMFDDEGNIVSC